MRRRHATLLFSTSLVLFACGEDKTTSTDTQGTGSPDADATDTVLVDMVGFDTGTGTPDVSPPDAGGEVINGDFAAPCQGNVDCSSGYCVEGPEGFVCTRGCDEECPGGYDCRGVQSGSADTVFLCMPRVARLCVPCKADYQCTGGACLELGDGGQCASICADDGACPDGYKCRADAAGAHAGKFCQPVSGSCDCTQDFDGAVRTCANENEQGACYGVETCDPDVGWVGCTAATAVAEVCDGRDNDCDALVDDGVETNVPCENAVGGVGACQGLKVCVGTQGYVCTAATPQPETCDFRDNDCDGATDEDFKDEAGDFTLAEHCGTCNNDCSTRIANGTGNCEIIPGASPVCVVAACDPDYVELNRFQCALPPDVSCLPCESDAECYDGSCIDLDGQRACVVPCGDTGSCQDGYRCEPLAAAGGEERCVPVTSSCLCNPKTDGQTRTCIRSSNSGTCYGQETCDAASGWVGCSARTPADEICNGVDDDCSSGVDDVPGRGNACTNANGFGTCPGVRDCEAGAALACVGPTPAAETCNYEDDDCDGQTDEGYASLYQSCSSGVGACQRYGFVECKADGSGTTCNAVAGTAQAEACDGLDNDCDSQTDETFVDVGDLCFAGEGACRGVGTKVCKADGTATECTAAAGAPGTETCDQVDNDCDGATDETFKDGAGKYATDTTCGNCATDCTVIYDKPSASGACDASTGAPACEMRCDAGFYDLNGVPDDGCEFQLESGALYVSESSTGAKDDVGCGVGPSATGGGRYPCATISYAITKAATPGSGKTRVLVAGGGYTENLTLADGISVYGGYNPVNWVRNPASNLTAIFGVQASGHRKTVVADGITVNTTTFDGFAVYGQIANGVGENSYAIWVRNSSGKLKISNNTIWPGAGGPGQNGTRGNDGGNGGDGTAGQVARETSAEGDRCAAECTGQNTGGTGGTNPACSANTAGGRGGHAPCPDFNESVNLCTSNVATSQQSSNPGGVAGGGAGGGAAGVGGCDHLTDPGITDCNCLFPTTNTTCPLGGYSGDGGNGAQGTAGSAGQRNASGAGEVSSDNWRGFPGTAGGNGQVGSGGGGGGAGGGVESFFNTVTNSCSGSKYSDFGGSGGGGGAGGCGGAGGTGGGGGGGAFGIFVLSGAGGADLPAIRDNDIHLGFGGRGGRGGDGGTAGDGGNGGAGGGGAPGTTAWCAQPGSKGGEGGDGGPGGGGGGGAGGAAYGLYASGGSLPAWGTGNTFHEDGAGGAGGAGGGTGAGGNAGQNGPAGTAAAHNL